MSKMIERDKWGHPLYIATVCGHLARYSEAERCKPCDVERRRGVPIRTPKYDNYLGVGPKGKAMYMAACGHPATSPRAKKCAACRTAGYESRGYKMTRVNGKPTKNHRIIAEKVLGRPLRKGEVVHHINMDKRDNRNCNLLICDASYHRYLHRAMEKAYGRLIVAEQEKTA
jgi:hypothetical protein